MKHLAILALILGLLGCQSVEEMAEWESRTVVEHKKVLVECKGKARAYRESLERKKALMKQHEIIYKINNVYGRCFEENLPGLHFWDVAPPTSLDIQSKNSIRFYTGEDHMLKKFLERSRGWSQDIRDNKDPWPGY